MYLSCLINIVEHKIEFIAYSKGIAK